MYAVTAVYFAGVMVRLMLTLTPCVCVLAGIAFSHTYELFLYDETEAGDKLQKRKKTDASVDSTTEIAAAADGDADARNRQLYDKAQKTLNKKGKNVPSSLSATIPASGGGKTAKGERATEAAEEESIGMNVRTIISVTLVIILLMFAVHCTWVTSNAYSSPSIVLASYRDDG